MKITNAFIYDIVNKTIFAELEKGNIPWQKPWLSKFPVNLSSKKDYQGFNWWMLMIMQEKEGYKSNIWATFKQIAEKGGKVKKGQHSTPVIYWKILEFQKKEIDPKTGLNKIDKIPLLRYYRVFNLDQTEGIKLGEEKEVEKNLDSEEIINHYKKQIKIKYGGDQAFYDSKNDYIQIPVIENFKEESEFYGITFHEMIHSTGHEKRLNRFKEDNNVQSMFGSESYSKEELTAEMGSAYLCAKVKILPNIVKNKTAYIRNWLGALKNDKTLLVSAGGKAQKAVEFILK